MFHNQSVTQTVREAQESKLAQVSRVTEKLRNVR